MKLLLSAATALLLVTGCKNGDDPASPPAAPTPDQLHYLALGDSYTIGESVPRAESFPFQLTAALQGAGYNFAAPTVIAQTGWRSDVLLSNIRADNVGPRADLVTILIGVNDQYQGRPAEGFRQNFVTLLDRAEALAKGGKDDIVVVTIPDYSATPFAVGTDTMAIRVALDEFDAVITEESARRGLPVVDITPGSKAARTDGSLVAGDGLHPSGKMYGQWVRQLVPVVEEVLK